MTNSITALVERARRGRFPLLVLAALGAFAWFTVATGQEKPAGQSDPSKQTEPDAKQTEPAKETKPANGQAAAGEEPAIRASAAAFLRAFNSNEAKEVAGLWTESGTLTDENGETHKGREAIEKQYADLFRQHPGARLVISIRSIHFPARDLAEEEGVAQVIFPGGATPVASRYTAIHVRNGANWQMASVRESPVELPSNAGRLGDVAWLVGDWKAERGDTTVRLGFRWIANQSFLEQTHTVTQDGIVTATGVHIIGWDPSAGRIRSWAFDSSGGFGSGLWEPAEDGYRIVSHGLLSNGVATSSRDFLIRVAGEDHVLGWRSIDRSVGDQNLPDTAEVVLDRVTKN